ncbi:MAG: 5-formyltetrahydrofolate cyclo-ligase [Bacillota bacterium]|jgi:5-formyltetrahydrofolate cyclo-ligase
MGGNIKKQLRRSILQARSSLTPQEVEKKSEVICRKILQLSEFRDAHTVMAYLPFKNEVDVIPLFDYLWSKGKRAVIPVCDPRNIVLIPSELKDLSEDLAPGTWGILEPKKDKMRPVHPEDIDCVIIPGVGFDASCNRLGYGGGYYDRFLPRLKENTPKIAVAYQIQIVSALVPDIYDVPMDRVITEENEYGL